MNRLLFVFTLFVGAALLPGCKMDNATRSSLGEADGHWKAGKKAEAVAIYKKLAETSFPIGISENERAKMFQRVVEFDLEQGDFASAKSYLDQAEKEKVRLPREVTQSLKSREKEAQAKKEAADREATAQAEREKKEAVRQADQEKKRQAEIVAQKKKLEQVPDLLRRLKDENAQVRAIAASELAQIKPLPAGGLEILLVAVNDNGDPLSLAIRLSAIKALGNCESTDNSLKTLEALLADENIAVQSAAMQTLKELGKAGLPGVTKALAHPNLLIRGQAARILADAGDAARKSVPDLVKAMKDEQEEGTRVWMAGAILKLDPDEPAPIAVLIKALDPGRAVATRKTAAEFLAEAGPRAKAAIPALVAIVKIGAADEATAARTALEKIKK